MKLKHSFMVIFLLIGCCSYGQDITENKFGKGLFNVVAEDSSYSAKFTVRMQSRFTSDWTIPESGSWSDAETNFLIRRARLKLKGFAFSPKLEYKLQVGLSNRDISGASEFTGGAPRMLYDAVIKWNFHDNFELWVGQTKLPGNREQLISSGSLETVDRSLVNSYFSLGREAGVQLHHSFALEEGFIVREAISVSHGEGRNITANNLGGHHFMGRVELLPMGDFDAYSGADLDREEDPRLAVGASYSYNTGAVREESNGGAFMVNDQGFFQADVRTLFLDAMFKYNGFSLMGEYARRSAGETLGVNADGTFTGDAVLTGSGVNFQAGYLFGNDWQAVGRYTYMDLDNSFSQWRETQYTFALSKYIVKHTLKVQTDLSYTDLNRNFNNGLLYRLQFEIQF